MSECATFADDIKSTYSFQAGWHFIDQPYLDKGGSLSDFTFKYDTYDILGALTNLTQCLEGSGTDYLTSYYHQQIALNFPNDADARSFALRMIIHYVGDIHQPLHTVAMVDATYPSGDMGGNKEYLPSICGASNLHSVWDSVAYNYCGYPVQVSSNSNFFHSFRIFLKNLTFIFQPLSDADWEWYSTTASSINNAYPADETKLKDGDFAAWAQEGYDLAVSTVYPGKYLPNNFLGYVNSKTPLTAEYVAACDHASREHMMYGARRLANLMVQIYDTTGSRAFLQ